MNLSCRSIIPICSSLKPQIPLFLRPATSSASLSDIQKWHKWAKTLASSVGSSFVNSDNGPDAALLRRELNWLMEDAIELDVTNPHLSHSKLLHQQNGSRNSTINLRTQLEDLYSLWKQRIEERRPFQYIVGCEHWRDLVLSVQEGVLIPRPETVAIVDLVGDLVSSADYQEGLWADLGTGSGALAIGIARILGTRGSVIATDLSPLPVAVASYNVQRYALQDVIEVRQGSWFDPLKAVAGKFAGVVSNPPYIPSDLISGLQAEVGRHEPRVALDGGVNGMDDLLHLCNGIALMLKPGGFFALETNGENQCKFLVDYINNELEGSFCNVKIVSDFSRIERFVTGFRQ